MPSTAITAQGSTLSIDGTNIENIVSFTGFDGESAEIAVTNLESVAKEFLIGLTDPGNFSFEYHPNTDGSGNPGQEALRDAAVAGTSHSFILTMSDAETATFSALVKNANSMTGGVDAPLAGTASLKVSGAITFSGSVP